MRAEQSKNGVTAQRVRAIKLAMDRLCINHKVADDAIRAIRDHGTRGDSAGVRQHISNCRTALIEALLGLDQLDRRM